MGGWWCLGVLTCTPASRCLTEAWWQQMTSTRVPGQPWLEEPQWSVWNQSVFLLKSSWAFAGCTQCRCTGLQACDLLTWFVCAYEIQPELFVFLQLTMLCQSSAQTWLALSNSGESGLIASPAVTTLYTWTSPSGTKALKNKWRPWWRIMVCVWQIHVTLAVLQL